MKKSILALLLAVLMVASLLPAAAMADGEAVAKIGDMEYPTLAQAVAEATEDNNSIELLKDVELSSTLSISKTVELDLGGFTLSFNSGNVISISASSEPVSVTISNGTVLMDAASNNYSNAAINVAHNCTLYIDVDATVIGPFGISVVDDTNSGADVKIDIHGTVRGLQPGDCEYSYTYGTGGITVNGTIKNTDNYPVINIYPGAVVSGSRGTSANANYDDGPAIYAAGYAAWNISGGTISGDEALSIKSGKFNITGGEFIATGVFQNPATSWGNGSEATGAAISITTHNGYAKKVTLNIEGGTFFSKDGYAVYESDTKTQTGSALSAEGISISGGSFKGAQDDDLFSKNALNFVTKGEFNNPVAAEYLSDTLQYQVKNGSTYTYYDTFENALNAAEYGAKITGIAEGLDKPYYDLVIDPANGGEVKSVNAPSGSTFTIPTVSKSGCAFLGWSDGTTTYPAGTVITVTSDVTYTASWVRHPDTPYVPEPEEPEEPETPVFPFYDVPTSAWYYTAVKYVYDNKLMDGVDTYEFAPNATLTRAMVWTIIARMSGVDTTGGNSWYAKAQEWVITNGISDGENPTAAITREEFVTMLWRLAGEPIYTGDLSRVPDAGSISTWAQNAMLWSYVTSLTEGDENGALTPLATATRAQAAAMIMRFCESVK